VKYSTRIIGDRVFVGGTARILQPRQVGSVKPIQIPDEANKFLFWISDSKVRTLGVSLRVSAISF
jgi:hypothetical protein